MYMIMNSKKPHLWKGEYRSFVDIAKLESIGYDVLKKAFYKSRDIKQAVDYAKNTYSIKDYAKYEYKGALYNQSQFCKILAKDTGLTAVTIQGRIKAGWTIDEIVSTPVNKSCERVQKQYNAKMGAQVKIYDLDGNLLQQFDTYNEAAKFLGTSQTNVVSTCMRFGIFQGKYKIRSKSSSLEKKESDKKKRKSKNDKWCRVVYPTPELSKLASKRCREITKIVYYEKYRDSIIQKNREYYYRNFDVKSVYNKEHYASNKDYIREKHKEWVARNKDKNDEYHINYRRNASDKLSDVYIKTTLATTLGLNASQITPEMIDIKRKQVKLYRSLK